MKHIALAFFTAAVVLGFPGAAVAHDPGLSSLELRVSRGEIAADLSMAAADAAALGGSGADVARLGSFALQAIDLRIDGRRLEGRVEDIASQEGSAIRVRLQYVRTPGSRLAVRSAVPSRLARGHRQLLSIRNDADSLLLQRMLDANSEGVGDLSLSSTRAEATRQFFVLGLHHIVGGYDHLLFLGALLLVVRSVRDAVTTLTAFTVAHSLTLGLAVTGVVNVPAWIVEPLIAASIVYVGLENLLRQHPPHRWKLTFGLGLIHGFGFAGALRELGIGSSGLAVALPLGAFNLGVEAGQIAVALVTLPLWWALRAQPALSTRLTSACSVLIVCAGG
ncbi:MAG TPA: HupE/UreJ family protein, partial [Vicinamibacterales bacterium]|nr:HupE/UreJ family protein [Vicinamibacterales bacterium]